MSAAEAKRRRKSGVDPTNRSLLDASKQQIGPDQIQNSSAYIDTLSDNHRNLEDCIAYLKQLTEHINCTDLERAKTLIIERNDLLKKIEAYQRKAEGMGMSVDELTRRSEHLAEQRRINALLRGRLQKLRSILI